MKLLTLNCHSIQEPDYENKLIQFADGIAELRPDIIALQEVNQTLGAPEVLPDELYVPNGEEHIRIDNHALRVSALLKERGIPMYWTWSCAKIGYGKYEEGLAVFSRTPVQRASAWYTTGSREISNWRVRKAVALTSEVDGKPAQFVSVHMGWWEDEEEPFTEQWGRLEEGLSPGLPHILMGDLNSPAGVKGEGYDYVTSRGFSDTFISARVREGDATVASSIDGWRDKPDVGPIRIDYILTDCAFPVEQAKVMFDGERGPIVSDHFGFLITANWEGNT